MIFFYRWAFPALLVIALLSSVFMLGMREERTRWESRWAERDAQDLQAQAQQEAAARNTEQARQRQNEEIQAHAVQEIDRARANAAADRADADRMRKRFAVLASQPSCAAGNTASTASGQASPAPGLLLTDVFGWADARAAGLAEAYDRARIAGLSCERAYDALRTGSTSINSQQQETLQ